MQQHLGNAAGAAVVAVDLEGRVCIEEVVVAAAAVGHLDDIAAGVPERQREVLAGPVAVQAAAVGVRLPAHRPSRHIAVAGYLSVVGCLEQTFALGTLVEGADLREREETHQVGEVAMSRVGERVVLPLGDAGLVVVGLCPEALVEVVIEVLYSRNLRGRECRFATKLGVSLHDLVQEFVACLLSKCGDIVGPMLGAEFVLDFVASVLVLRGVGLDEEGALVHNGQGFPEELPIHSIFIVAPQVCAVPGSEGLHAAVAPGGGAAEDVVLHSDCPALGSALDLGGELVPGRVAAGSAQVQDVVQEGQVHLREVGGVGGPVVHLDIDVGMYVAMPERAVAAVVPDALQVGWRMNAGVQVGPDGEVASVLEVERLEEESVAGCLVLCRRIVELDEVLGGLRRGIAQLQADAVHQGAVGGLVVGEQSRVSLTGSLVDACGDGGCQSVGICSADAAFPARIVVGCRCHDDVHPCGTGYADAHGRGTDGTIGLDPERRVVADNLQLAAEGGRGRPVGFCLVGRVAGVDLPVGSIADAECHLFCAFCFVACHEDAVGGRGEVATMEAGLVIRRLEVDAGYAVDDVEKAVVVLDGLLVGSDSREGVASVFDQNRAEALEVALIVGIGGSAAPEGLLVELDVVAEHASANGGTHLSVAQGQGILHPGVGNTRSCSRDVVPEGEVVDVGGSRTLLSYTELGGPVGSTGPAHNEGEKQK